MRLQPLNPVLLTSRQDNGGKIVALEKFADLLIADHVIRRDAPAGAVSWKYIDESVARGELLDTEDYLVHPANAPTNAPTKSVRTPFTKEDEQILVTWVRRQEAAGESSKGNAIYEDLAKSVSHPWPLSTHGG